MEQKQAFIFFGASGSGKGTQAELLKKYLEEHHDNPIAHVETGNRFRAFKSSEKYVGKKIYETLNEGGLLPVFLSVWNWTEGFFEDLEEDSHIILDGSPRRKREPILLESAFDYFAYEKVNIVYLDVPTDELITRLLSRGRHDDTEESLRKRLAWFNESILPMLDFYKSNDRYNFIPLNGTKHVEEVHKELLEKTEL
jgi:adenylate kinase